MFQGRSSYMKKYEMKNIQRYLETKTPYISFFKQRALEGFFDSYPAAFEVPSKTRLLLCNSV